MGFSMLFTGELGILAVRHGVVKIFIPLMAVFSLIVLLVILFRRPRL
jgi:hypothetical protein